MDGRSLTREIAGFAVDAVRSPLPGEVLQAARLCLLDALGCGLYGSTLADGRAVVSAVRGMGGVGPIPVWGTPYATGADVAALANGTLCHLRELDDVHYTITHPGAVCVPAAMAVADLVDASLGDLLVALVVGYEVMVAVSRSLGYVGHRQLGWHGTATCGAFGAAAAAACLLGLDARQTASALGLAGSRTGGTWAFKADGAMSKRLHPGLAARDGVAAAFLAREGVTGPEYVLEAEDGGLGRLMSRSWSPEAALDAWGRPWAVCASEFKAYAACKSVHSPLEAARKIALEAGRPPAEVASVRVEVNSTALAMAGRIHEPGNVTSAQLSIPYGVAVALLGGEGGAGSYTEEWVQKREVYDLARRVQVVSSPELDELRLREHKSAARVQVTWADGTTSVAFVDSPRGSQGNPLRAEDVLSKFLELAGAALKPGGAGRVADLVLKGGVSTEVKELGSSLVAQPGDSRARGGQVDGRGNG